jgi:hypothetical protein
MKKLSPIVISGIVLASCLGLYGLYKGGESMAASKLGVAPETLKQVINDPKYDTTKQIETGQDDIDVADEDDRESINSQDSDVPNMRNSVDSVYSDTGGSRKKNKKGKKQTKRRNKIQGKKRTARQNNKKKK